MSQGFGRYSNVLVSDGINLNDLAWHGMATIPFFFNTSFGVFSHEGFGGELLSDSTWFSGANPP